MGLCPPKYAPGIGLREENNIIIVSFQLQLFIFLIMSGLITKKRFKSKTSIEFLRKTGLNKLRGK